MKTIFGLIVFSIVSLSLLVWLLFLGFQTQSLVDVLTLGGAFGPWSAYDIFLIFGILLMLLLPFIVFASTIFRIH